MSPHVALSLLLAVRLVVAGLPAQDDEPPQKPPQKPPDEKQSASLDLRAGDDEHKRYFLTGPPKDAEPPEDGYKLLLVLPGGDGSADFRAFVERIARHAAGDDYLVAQLVAPRWSEDQFESLVWPTREREWKGMEFPTEDFVTAVIEDVERRHPLDPAFVFTLAWSSGGPAAYAISLSKDSRVTGSFVAMSVFKPGQLPSLKRAKGHAYYLLHSPEDFIPIRMAETAHDELTKRKAVVQLSTYPGGHGWRGDVYGMMRAGLDWLEENHAKPAKKRRPARRRGGR